MLSQMAFSPVYESTCGFTCPVSCVYFSSITISHMQAKLLSYFSDMKHIYLFFPSRMAVALYQLLQMKQNLFYVTTQLQEIIYFIYISCIVASDVHVAAHRISNVICDFFWNNTRLCLQESGETHCIPFFWNRAYENI